MIRKITIDDYEAIAKLLIKAFKAIALMIEDFYVDPDYQRMGIGGKMLTLLEKKVNEVDSFMLLTGKGFYSVDFYQKMGL